MKKTLVVILLLAFTLFAMSAIVYAEAPKADTKAAPAKATPATKEVKPPAETQKAPTAKGKSQDECLCGKKVDKKIFVDYKDKRIYACSEACKKMITKDPTKAMKDLEKKGFAIEVIPPPVAPKTPTAPKSSPTGKAPATPAPKTK